MPVTPTYPGVYIEEIPSGVRTITGVATSITAFVGYTARGPVNRAERILSFGDYERLFGGLHLDSEVSYAVQQFFLNGGTDAYVVRVATGAAAAGLTLKWGTGATENALIVTAADAGLWGNLVRLDVDYATSNPHSTFNLGVTRYERRGTLLQIAEQELFRNLSMNSHSPTYALNVLNAGSRLLRLDRPASLFAALTGPNDRGYSLSRNLSTLPTIQATETTLTGILDGNVPFTLVVSNQPSPPGTINTLRNRITDAIAAAPEAAGRLDVIRANADGTDNAGAGNFLKLRSINPPDPEFSSVVIVPAAANDLAARLGFGLAQSGRERETAAARRPLQTGTTSAELAASLGTDLVGATALTLTITNRLADGTDEVLVNAAPIDIPAPPPTVAIGVPLAQQLQTLIRGVANAAAQNAVVQLVGSRLRIVPSAESPNARVTIGGAGAGTIGFAAGAIESVQQYSLGSGVNFGGQASAILGSDGTPPGVNDLRGSYAAKTGLYALRDVDLFNLLVIPRTTLLTDTEARSLLADAIAFCAERRAFLLVDPAPNLTLTTVDDWVGASGITAPQTGKNGAVFFPRIMAADPLDGFRLHSMPASGAIAGVFARTDAERGVWKAPAGVEAAVRGAQGLSLTLTDPENGTLNPLGINCLRTFPVYGTVIWGARTLEGADRATSEWKYIPVRRIALFIEESLFRGTKWVVFEPNDEPLWAQIRLNVGAFMQNLFRQGAFAGTTPREAYFVKCDKETTTQNDVNLGIVNILVGFAPLKPAEFVIIQIQQMAGQIQV